MLAARRVLSGNLVVDARALHDISNSDRAQALLAGIRKLGIYSLPWNDARSEWQARVARMRDLPVQGQASIWPAVDDDALMNQLDDWWLPWLEGIGSIKALQQLDLQKNPEYHAAPSTAGPDGRMATCTVYRSLWLSNKFKLCATR